MAAFQSQRVISPGTIDAHDRPGKLTFELIDALFERSPPMYRSLENELAAVLRGDKGNAESMAPPDAPYTAEFVAQARKAGLSVRRRRLQFRELGEVEQVCATRPNEEWRAEVLEWMWQALQSFVAMRSSCCRRVSPSGVVLSSELPCTGS